MTTAATTWVGDPVHSEVRDFDGETFTPAGELTVYGVTRSGELETELLGVVADPSGAERISATATISRAAFGADIQLGFGAGNVVVADTIEIEFTANGLDIQ